MTILQMRSSDEGSQPAQKKRRLSSHQAWITAENRQDSASSHPMPTTPETMKNGLGLSDQHHQDSLSKSVEDDACNDRVPPIASLSNLGNTCFLNSVLYTLRFAPSFLHKLHHLNFECVAFSKQLNANKQDRTISLGRNITKNHHGSGDACFGEISCFDMKTQTVISKLHSLYASLHLIETKETIKEPFQANSFVDALREVNPIFEGNQQHDAHELLVCILDIIREACELLYQQNNVPERTTSSCANISTTGFALKSVIHKSQKSLKLRKLMRRNKKTKSRKFCKLMHPDKKTITYLRENHSEGDIKKYLINGDGPHKDDNGLTYVEDIYPTNQNTIFDDFRGISLLRTTCLECEQMTERKETICDICVPIKTVDNFDDAEAVEQLYKSMIVTEEYLVDCNKYWCERCSRYNEAKRCVRYEKLPRLLTLHLKRFSSGFGNSVAKVNEHMPTPFTLPCFCEECLLTERAEERRHCYSLYAIIMHIGSSLTSGHYTAFVKTYDTSHDYWLCTRDKPKTSSLSRGTTISSMSMAPSNGLFDKSALHFNKVLNKFLKSSAVNGGGGSGEQDLAPATGRSPPTCKGIECCGIRWRSITPSAVLHSNNGDLWLACDDEQVSLMSMEQLLQALSPSSCSNKNTVSSTPYLLFYSKVENNS